VIDRERLRELFAQCYPSSPRLFYAPGRVNLIGEHTDYNNGFVMPVAIDRGTMVGAAGRSDRRVRVRSINIGESAEFDLDRPGPARRGSWLDYVEGVAQCLESRGVRLNGADILILSDVAVGAGLSSSAALEVSVGMALAAVSGKVIDRRELALAAQQAEHRYVGIQSGLMDQYIALFGKSNHSLLLDCRSLDYDLIPLDLSQTALVICDTRVRHSLASSEYNARRSECQQGVRFLQEVLPAIESLRDVSPTDFHKHHERLPEPIRRRCRHVVTENERTLEAAAAFRSGRLADLKRLMAGSHRSLRDDYEVSCLELDLMVQAASDVPGVTGARMTGGGFGGCTVNLVRREALDQFHERVTLEYQRATGLAPAIFTAEASDGAREYF
jgi:galactokinase